MHEFFSQKGSKYMGLITKIFGTYSERELKSIWPIVHKIEGMEDRRDTKVIRAKVPLGEMFGYATDLRSQTQGRASYTMQFDSYEPVPKNIRDEIVAKNGGSAS